MNKFYVKAENGVIDWTTYDSTYQEGYLEVPSEIEKDELKVSEDGLSLVEDDSKKEIKRTARQLIKDAKDAKKLEKKAIKQLAKGNLNNAERDQLIKFLVNEFINDED